MQGEESAVKILKFESLEPSDEPHPDKDKIILFMRHGRMTAVAPGIPTDWITGKPIPCDMISYRGFGWYWTTMDIWHFETYNLELPRDFIEIAREHCLDHWKTKLHARNTILKLI